MPATIHYAVTDRVAVLTIDNPPVNVLSPAVFEALDAAVARAAEDAGVDALVLIGGGSTFVAGADIAAFKALDTFEKTLAGSAAMHASLHRLEDSAKPVVAAIRGHALGGGLELAMACHARVAVAGAVVGQPEVALGLIPGAGGTERLPRLCGGPTALAMCLDGRPVRAPQARDAGIVDAIADGDLLTAALAHARALAAAGTFRRTRDVAFSVDARRAGFDACATARRSLPAEPRAPHAVVDALEAALTLDFERGSARERELFANCMVSAESRAMRHLFFAEREAQKVPDLPKDTPTLEVKNAAVVGAGTMGAGIATTFANAGIPVRLTDVDPAALDRAMRAIGAAYEARRAKGALSAEAVARALSLITPAVGYDAFETVDVVVEAVVEDLAVKQATFATLGRVTRADCLLASNTSTLDLDAMAEASHRPGQVVGLHFFNPAPVMTLLEVVRGRETTPSTLASALRLGKRLGKVSVVVGNGFGFVANRLLGYYLREAHLLLDEGASVAQIDGVFTRFGLPVGPFGMEDLIGLDVCARVRQARALVGRTWAEGPDSAVPDRLVALGRLGQKTGAGWYRYEPSSRTPLVDPLVEALAAESASARGVARRAIDDAEILERALTALANEGARALGEGVARRAADIDVIYAYGFGFPRYRGGPMFQADAVGLSALVARIDDYRARLGPHWHAAPLLLELAASGRDFLS